MSGGFNRSGTSSPILVTGPARSGKSEWAERLALESGRSVVYIATALEDANDAEWSARIEAHRRRRPADWETLCAPVDLPNAITASDLPDRCLLVDSLGTWTANLLDRDDAAWSEAARALTRSLADTTALVILVGEEAAWGVIPAYPEGRLFRDRLGGLIRRIGPMSAAAYLVTGGFALDLTRLGIPLD